MRACRQCSAVHAVRACSTCVRVRVRAVRVCVRMYVHTHMSACVRAYSAVRGSAVRSFNEFIDAWRTFLIGNVQPSILICVDR